MPETHPQKSPVIYWTSAQVSPGWLGRAHKTPLDYLIPTELERYKSFKFEKRQREWLNGRLIAKSLLKKIFPEQPLSRMSIENELQGAPFYAIDQKRQPGSLSISHSGGVTCAAFCPNVMLSVGIDVEKVETRPTGFAQDYFTTREITFITDKTQADHQFWETLTWSIKESALKALKIGLRRDTREIEIGFDHDQAISGGEWIPAKVMDLKNPPTQWQGWWKVMDETVITIIYISAPGDIQKPGLQKVDLNC